MNKVTKRWVSFFLPFVILTYKLAVCTSACHAVVDTNTYSRLLSFSSFFLFFFSFRPVVRHVRHNLIWPNLIGDRTRTHTNAIECRRTARCHWCKGRYMKDSQRRTVARTNMTLVLTNPGLKTRSSKLLAFTRHLHRPGGFRFSFLVSFALSHRQIRSLQLRILYFFLTVFIYPLFFTL